MFKAQIEESGEAWLKELLLTEFGGWSLINQSSNLSLDYIEQLVMFHKLSSQPIFKIGITQNPNDHNYSLLKV